MNTSLAGFHIKQLVLQALMDIEVEEDDSDISWINLPRFILHGFSCAQVFPLVGVFFHNLLSALSPCTLS